jgi:DNA-binding NarL/FixJ family response regulator
MQTVFVVAANRFFRESLLRLFRSDRGLRVLGAAESSPLIGDQVSRANPQIVALNPEWDDSAYFATRAIHQAAPRAKILMIGMKDDHETFIKAVRAGAVGYLLQDASGKQILAAIHQLTQRSVVCPPHLEWILFDLVAGRATVESFFRQSPPNLTPREQELGSLVAKGLANKEIAERLNLSVQTVKNHVHSILRKAQVKSRSALARRFESQASSSANPLERPPSLPGS